jgi:hypothetical protein
VSGHISMSTTRRCSAIAARATQPPRPSTSRTASPGFVQAKIWATMSSEGASGASRSKAGSWGTLSTLGEGLDTARPTMPQLCRLTATEFHNGTSTGRPGQWGAIRPLVGR